MRPTAIASVIAVICLFLCLSPSAGNTQYTQTFRADSTMDGNAGSIFRIVEPGSTSEDIFIFEEEGKYRVYAIREDGDSWVYLTPAQYFCPVSSMTVGETWRHINRGLADETKATVTLQEDITIPAGTFSCYKVDVEEVANPGVIVQSLWVSDGYGLIKESWFEGDGYWISDLESYYATGTGFMPRDVGNWWAYGGYLIGTEESSWGAIKKQLYPLTGNN